MIELLIGIGFKALLAYGVDMSASGMASGDTGHSISGQSYIDCQNGDKTQCAASQAYDLIAPLYPLDCAEYTLTGNSDLCGEAHTKGRAEYENRTWVKQKQENYGFNAWNQFIGKRR